MSTQVKANKKVINFLQTCGNQNLMYLLEPARLQQALAVLDTDRDGQIDAFGVVLSRCPCFLPPTPSTRRGTGRSPRREDAIENGEGQAPGPRGAAPRAGDDGPAGGQGARGVHERVQERGAALLSSSSTSTRAAFAVERGDRQRRPPQDWHRGERIEKVIKFLNTHTHTKTCGEENLQFLLHPPRLQKALEILDTDKSGEVDADECAAARRPPSGFPVVRLTSFRAQGGGHQPGPREAHRAAQGRAGAAGAAGAAAADSEFSEEFLNAARKCFRLIDRDDSGTLEKAEIVRAVRADKEVIDFLNNCGNQNLQYLLVPSRLEAALLVLDTDRDGHIDEEEWQDAIESALAANLEARACVARAVQAKAAQKEIEEFTDSFLNGRGALLRAHRQGRRRVAQHLTVWKSMASHAMDATYAARITQLTGRCPRRQGRDRQVRLRQRIRSHPLPVQLAARRTCSSCCTCRACRRRSRSWTPTSPAKWTARKCTAPAS